MGGLEIVYGRLCKSDVTGDIWVHGSFLTSKTDPDDADIILEYDARAIEHGPEEPREVIDWINSNLYDSHRCHSFTIPRYNAGDPDFAQGEWMRAYWIRQFGFCRKTNFKGMARLPIYKTNDGVSTLISTGLASLPMLH